MISSKKPKIVLDIETVGKDLEDLDFISQDYLKKMAKRQNYDQESTEMKTSISPLTAEVVVIGMYNPKTRKGKILYQAGNDCFEKYQKDGIEYVCGAEKEILEIFWQTVIAYKSIITFNGRYFDIPFLLIRSAVHKIKITKNLLPPRYSSVPNHIDLFDQMTFYNNWGGLKSLHFYCKAFGIKSPKEGDITGYDVKRFYKKGEYKKIAEYNLGDLKATAELYDVWNKYLS